MAGQRNSYGKRSRNQSGDDGGSKRRIPGDDREQFVIGPEDTVYRYLCPVKKIGSIIGRGGEIIKQLRLDTKAKIRISETVPGCEERIVTIYSPSDESNSFEDSGDLISPAQDALFRVHERVIAEDLNPDEEPEKGEHISTTARLLVQPDQIGCIIGKGGQIVQNIRNETGAQIRILMDKYLPPCALSSDKLVQVSGEVATVKNALYQIASRLHENPSKSQNLLNSAAPSVYQSGGSFVAPPAGAPLVGLASLMGPYGAYKPGGDWSQSLYSAPRDEASSKDFSLRLVCPTGNIGGVIGKGGSLINQLRQESGATIVVDSSRTEGDDCLITVSSKEFFDDAYSPTVEAAARLQPRCSEKVEKDSGVISYTTRLLVPSTQIGCLIGKGGSIITEMRKVTRANIRIISKDSKDSLPKIASEDDEMVMISGDIDVVKDALIQVTTRLRANLFGRDGAVSTFLPVLPYLPLPTDGSDRLKYESRDSKRYGRGETYSSGYSGSGDLADGDSYGSYSVPQIGAHGSAYRVYDDYSSGRTSSSRLSSQISHRKTYDY